MLEVLIASLVLLAIAVAGMGIRMLFKKDAGFSGGSCQATSSSTAMQEKGISCGCGGGTCENS